MSNNIADISSKLAGKMIEKNLAEGGTLQIPALGVTTGGAKDSFTLQLIETFVADVCREAEATIQATGKLEGAHYAAMTRQLEAMRRAVPNPADERWVVGQPGGPSGPFYSVVTQTGQIAAMQITDKWFAALIARIPQFLAQRRRWASLINRLATIIINGAPCSSEIDEANEAIAEVLPFLEGE